MRPSYWTPRALERRHSLDGSGVAATAAIAATTIEEEELCWLDLCQHVTKKHDLWFCLFWSSVRTSSSNNSSSSYDSEEEEECPNEGGGARFMVVPSRSQSFDMVIDSAYAYDFFTTVCRLIPRFYSILLENMSSLSPSTADLENTIMERARDIEHMNKQMAELKLAVAEKKVKEPCMPYSEFILGLGTLPKNEEVCHAVNVKGDGFCSNSVRNGGKPFKFEDGMILQFCCKRDAHWFFKNPELLTASKQKKIKVSLKDHKARKELLKHTRSNPFTSLTSRARAFQASDADATSAASIGASTSP
eukprot:gene17354-23657_t